MPSKKIGVTGRTASGKSTVSNLLAERLADCMVIDVDRLAKNIYIEDSSAMAGIVDIFGKKALTSQKKPDFDLIADTVFSDPKKLRSLNDLMFPRIKDKVASNISEHEDKTDYIIIDAAVLFECGLDEFCDYIVLVESDISNRKKRLIKKYPGLEEEKIDKRINGQFLIIDYDKADFIVKNDRQETRILTQVDMIIKDLNKNLD